MTDRTSGRIDIIATALDAIHHGRGISGNTALLRTQETVYVDPDTGELVESEVPFISGNSLKHLIRDGAVRYALDAMGVEDGALSRPVVNLLFSGGTLSKGGGSVDMAQARRMADLFPALSLCGYAASNRIEGGKIKVDNLHMVCAENRYRLPPTLHDSPRALHSEALYRSEEFGTRHDATRLPHVSRLLALEDRREVDLLATETAKRKTAAPKADDSAQMIYEFQTIKPGAQLWGAIHLAGVTHGEQVALWSGLSYACEATSGDPASPQFVFRLGGKGSVGYGRVAFALAGNIRHAVEAPAYEPSDAMLPALSASQDGDALEAYAAGLRERRDEILAFLAEVA